MKSRKTVFDSQASAAAALNLDLEIIRQAKRDGCPAFRNGRVHRAEIEEWLAKKNTKPGGTAGNSGSLRVRELELRCQKLEIENGRKAGELLLASQLESGFGLFMGGMSVAFNSLPDRLAGNLRGQRDYHVIKETIASELRSLMGGFDLAGYFLDAAVIPEIVAGLNLPAGMADFVRQGIERGFEGFGRLALAQIFQNVALPEPIEQEPPALNKAPKEKSRARKRRVPAAERSTQSDAAALAQSEIPTPARKRSQKRAR